MKKALLIAFAALVVALVAGCSGLSPAGKAAAQTFYADFTAFADASLPAPATEEEKAKYGLTDEKKAQRWAEAKAGLASNAKRLAEETR